VSSHAGRGLREERVEYELSVESGGRLVRVTWGGRVTDAGLAHYLRSVQQDPALGDHHELLDCRPVSEVHVTNEGLRELARLAAATDVPGAVGRVAIVADAPLSFGLARMYQSFREVSDRSTREVGVFRTLEEARSFLERGSGLDEPVASAD